MANVTLDVVSYNFGIQEYSPFNERTQEIFHGCPEMKDGYLWVSEKPGWGIEIDEKAAAKSPFAQSEQRAERRMGRNSQARRHGHQAVSTNRVGTDLRTVKAERSSAAGASSRSRRKWHC